MTYAKQTWADLDITKPLSAARMTHIEDGIFDADTGADADLAAHVAAADPHTGYQKESEKGGASGYAGLNASAVVPIAQLGTGTPTGSKFLRDDNVLAIPAGGGGGSSLAAVSYYIYQSGANYGARGNPELGLSDVAASGTDAATVLQTCMDNINGTFSPRGTIVFAPNTVFNFTGVTTPFFRRTCASGGVDDSLMTRILGSGGSVIKFTSGTGNNRKFMRFNRIADHDTFAGLEIGNLEFDDNGHGSSNDCVIGDITNGGVFGLVRVNRERLWFHDLSFYNHVPDLIAGGNKMKAFISIQTYHLGLGEGTQNTVRNIRMERIKTRGCHNCLYITADNTSRINIDGLAGLNIYGDNIYIADIDHDSLYGTTDPVTFVHSSIIQIGAGLMGDRMVIERVKGIGSGDNGIETNNFRHIVVKDCWIAGCDTSAYTPACFNYVNGANNNEQREQTWTYENCVAALTYANNGNQFQGWGFGGAGTSLVDHGHLIMKGCKTDCAAISLPGTPATMGGTFLSVTWGNLPKLDKVTLENCTADHFRNNTTATNYTDQVISFEAMPRKTVIKDMKINIRGAKSSTGELSVSAMFLNGTLAKDGVTAGDVDIDGVDIRDLTTGRANFTTTYINLGGITGYPSRFGGSIRRVRLIETPAITSTGFQIGALAASGGNFICDKLLIDDCNFSKLTADARYLLYQTGTDNQSAIYIRNAKRTNVNPPEITFTPAATTVAAQYIGNYEGLMSVTGGTVTNIEVSTDNVTFRSVGGATPASFYIDHGMYVKLTYTVVPTCRVIPRR